MTGWRLRVVTREPIHRENNFFVEYKPSLEIVFDFHTIRKIYIREYIFAKINKRSFFIEETYRYDSP